MSPKAFTEQEKELVRKRLTEAAVQALATTGIKKTSVEQLTRTAGISKGAFYLFYDSKELLFLDTLEQEQQRIHDTIIRCMEKQPSKHDGFVSVVGRMYRQFIHKPWLLTFTSEDYMLLLRRIPKERIMRHIELDDASAKRLTDILGKDVPAGPELLSAVLRMLFLGILHRKEVGEETADEAFDFILEAVAGRMFREEQR